MLVFFFNYSFIHENRRLQVWSLYTDTEDTCRVCLFCQANSTHTWTEKAVKVHTFFSLLQTPQKTPNSTKKKKLTPNSVKQSHYIRAQDHLTLELSQVSVMLPGSSISTSQSCSHTYPPRSAEWSISPSGAHIRSNGGDRGYLNPWQPGHNSINLFSVKVFDSLASLQK